MPNKNNAPQSSLILLPETKDTAQTCSAPAIIKKVGTYPMISGADMTSTQAGWISYGNLVYPFVIFGNTADGLRYGMLFSAGTDNLKAALTLLPSTVSFGGIANMFDGLAVGARWTPTIDPKTGKLVFNTSLGGVWTLVHDADAFIQAAADHITATNTMNVTGQARFAAQPIEPTVATQVGIRTYDGMQSEVASVGAGAEVAFGTPLGQVRLSFGRTLQRTTPGGPVGGPGGTKDIGSIEIAGFPGLGKFIPLVEAIRTSANNAIEVRAGLVFRPF